ncbi:hypothetical protein SCOCK_900011 [Actinacidiphila cocklensis]|uniref:Integrase catalytic domain-containing protein n=1 Tax=Actinacidiphila cocklensis TaxID=887465 RepID=A0A9W4GY68_9ACTN|nr:hypothetical protein SCOCK_900011 [Actinacidiphila cocklensis]
MPLACHRVAPGPGGRRAGCPGRPADLGGAAEVGGRAGRAGAAAQEGRPAGEGPGPPGRGSGSHGKSQRALGTALRERGLKHAVAPVVDEAFAGVQSQLGTAAACRLTGRSRATHYRHLNPKPKAQPSPRPTPVSALSPAERAQVLALLNRPEYSDLPPAQVWARELDAGNYWCSQRTMYRILSAAGQNGERRRQATHPPRTIPELVATGPSQVFIWDITRLPGPAKRIWFHAYVIIDIFSRYIVGHTVERAETGERAEELIREAIERNGIVPETVHADRGTSMTSKKVSQLLIDLGITRSHSRPRVSNDNPYSESQFRTTKYAALPRAVRFTDPRPGVDGRFHHLLQPRPQTLRDRPAHPRLRPLRHGRGGPRPAGYRSRRGIRTPPRTLRPPPETARDTRPGLDQRPRQTSTTRATKLIVT